MNTITDFHNLIDKIGDTETLKGYFKLISILNENQTGKIWENLNSEEKEELLVSYDESLNPKNLINHEEVKKSHEKWLKR